MQYSQDYDEMLLPGYLGGPRPRWLDNIQPYLKNSNVLTCPSFATQQFRGYGYNTRLSGSNNSLALIQKPAETVLVADAARIAYPPANDLDPASWVANGNCDWQMSWPQNGHWAPGSCCSGGSRRFHARHMDGGNVLWIDGHVKWTKGMDICANVPEGNALCLWDLQ